MTAPRIKEGYKEGDTLLMIVLGADSKETAATGYKDADARRWSARAIAAITPPLPSFKLENMDEQEKIVLALYKKLFAQLIDKCIRK